MPETAVNYSPDAPILSPPSSEARTAGRPQLAVLLAGSCMAVLGAVLLAPVLPQMTDAFGGTPGVDILVPIVLTVPALLIGLTAPFAGLIVDAMDRKRLLIVAMLVYFIVGTAPRPDPLAFGAGRADRRGARR